MFTTTQKQFISLFLRPVFLLLDFFAILFLSVSSLIKNPSLDIVFLTVGSTFIALALSLPVAIYYQLKHSGDSFKILQSCEKAGIRSVFVSRKKDPIELRDAIDDAAHRTNNEIFFLGIAFKSFFDPNDEHTFHVEDILKNYRIRMRVLLLDPNSEAAKLRESREIGSTTIDDIRNTIDHGLISTLYSRIDKYISENQNDINKLKSHKNSSEDQKEKLIMDLTDQFNCYVRLYQFNPITFIMGFDNCLFTEQYHLGRPPNLISPGACIGKRVPVLQYNKDSYGYEFLQNHFNFIWNKSSDITHTIIKKAINGYINALQ